MHVRELREIAAEDEEVERALVDVDELLHGVAGLWIAHRNLESGCPATGSGQERDVELVLAETRRRNGHERHGANPAVRGAW